MKKLTTRLLQKCTQYLRRKNRVNKTIKATTDRPRLIVARSNRYIFAQLVDKSGNVLVSAYDRDITEGTKSQKAYKVGELLAQQAVSKQVTEVAFDRNGYLFHGRVKQLAEGARAGGLQF